MVYVYAKKSELNKYVGKDLTVDEIKDTLMDLGMDIKGESADDDPQLKIEITAEKLDMVSAVGIARTIKYYRELSKEVPKYECVSSGLKLIVKESASLSRPKTVAAILKNVPMDEEFLNEIIKIQEKIHDSFGRGRKKAAIGIYPMTRIKFPITYGSENPKDIVFKPLMSDKQMDGHEIASEHEIGKKYAHLLKDYDVYPVFRDSLGKVLSMPPIINSHESGRVEKHHKDLFIECTGYNLQHLDNILKVLVTTFIDMGATALSVNVEYVESGETYEMNLDNYFDEIDVNYVNKLIGIDVDEKNLEKYLNKMMYSIKEVDGDKIKVEIPTFRSDVWHDVDIADDIARAYGYNNIKPTFPNVASIGEQLDFSSFRERISDMMTKLGFLEVYTYILTSTKMQFDKMLLDENNYRYVKLIDSAEQGINMTRISIMPESLQTLHINRKHKYPQRIFENGFTIQADDNVDTKARNEAHLCVSIADSKSNYTQIKGILDTLMKLNAIKFEVKESNEPFLIDGRRGDIYVKNEKIGFVGEVHPQILDNFGLLVPISSFEIDLEKLYELVK